MKNNRNRPHYFAVKKRLADIHIFKIGFESREGLVIGYNLLKEIQRSNESLGHRGADRSLEFDIKRAEDCLEAYYGGT